MDCSKHLRSHQLAVWDSSARLCRSVGAKRTKCAEARWSGQSQAATELARKSNRYGSISSILSLIGITLILIVVGLLVLGQEAQTTFSPVGP